jgi:cytochrome b involved in lipid metabolism
MAAVEEHSTTQVYELEECKRHTSQNDCWLVINGKVYNVTDFLDEHPGEKTRFSGSPGQLKSSDQVFNLMVKLTILLH